MSPASRVFVSLAALAPAACGHVPLGSLELAGDRVVARDIHGHELGRYGTSIEAVSTCFAAWRQDGAAPTQHSEELLCETIAARMKAGSDD